jgi:signal transduction histidine kinase
LVRANEGGLSVPEGQRAVSEYDDLPDGVIVADGAGTVVTVNAAAERILARPAEQLLAQPLVAAMPLVDPQGRDWWECTNPFGGLTSRTRQPERMLTVVRPDQADLPLLVTASYQRDADRRLQRVVVCFRDTRARARHERSGAELVSVVAHELRSPLTSVKGFTATLLAKWERFNDEQKLHMLQTVNADADRLTRLISELLDVSRIETGRLELRKQVVDLPELVKRDIDSRVAAGEAAERFAYTVDGTLPELWADPDKLAQVVGNLVENALRHGSGMVDIRVSADGECATVEVTDEGAGINREALPRIFTKFWHDAKRGGTGLGLFIAKGIVEAHGGTIEAGNSERGGAVVRFRLPAGTPSFAD